MPSNAETIIERLRNSMQLMVQALYNHDQNLLQKLVNTLTSFITWIFAAVSSPVSHKTHASPSYPLLFRFQPFVLRSPLCFGKNIYALERTFIS
ncbi:hypothetical protein N665_1877s0003 [Sinapis alba]|nr:hypothetical protein N665_1877s0003 [Sinapis alba]